MKKFEWLAVYCLSGIINLFFFGITIVVVKNEFRRSFFKVIWTAIMAFYLTVFIIEVYKKLMQPKPVRLIKFNLDIFKGHKPKK